MARTNSTGWRQKSTGFLSSIAALVLIVVLVGGMALGYEIEKGRVKTKKPAATAAQRRLAAARAKAAKTKKGKVVRVRITGTVTASSNGTITVAPKKGAARKIKVTEASIIDKSGNGSTSDIAANLKVVFSGAGSLTKAKDVILLPKSSRFGTMVTTATATTMSLKTGKKTTVVTTSGAAVDKTSRGKLTDITKGLKVMISAVRNAAGATTAIEIIVLPANSTFA